MISIKVASKQGTSEVLDNIYLAVLAVMNVSPILHFKKKKKKTKNKNKQKAPNTEKVTLKPTLGNKIKISKPTFISLPFRSLGSKTEGVVMRRKKRKEGKCVNNQRRYQRPVILNNPRRS